MFNWAIQNFLRTFFYPVIDSGGDGTSWYLLKYKSRMPGFQVYKNQQLSDVHSKA